MEEGKTPVTKQNKYCTCNLICILFLFTEAWVEQKEEQKGRSAVCAEILIKVLFFFLLCFIAELLYAWGLDCVFGLVVFFAWYTVLILLNSPGEWRCIALYKTGV